jgi:hypothetical protein
MLKQQNDRGRAEKLNFSALLAFQLFSFSAFAFALVSISAFDFSYEPVSSNLGT